MAKSILSLLPFEAFMENLQKRISIKSLLQIFQVKHVNATHLLLAKLAKNRLLKIIVTTNFDQLLEIALNQEGLRLEKDYRVIYKEEEFKNIDWKEDIITLIKIHGCISDKKRMAVTIKQIAIKDLLENRQHIINYVFSNGNHKNVVILGYSCSDIFDITIHIENIQNEFKKVFFIEHVNSKRVHEEALSLRINKNPFTKFQFGKRIICNTDALVRVLWTKYLLDRYHGIQEARRPFPWNRKTDRWIRKNLHEKHITELVIADLFFLVGHYKDALQFYKKGLSNFDYGQEAYIDILCDLAYVSHLLGEVSKGQKYIEMAHKNIGDKLHGKARIRCISSTAFFYLETSHYDKALQYYRQAVSAAKKARDPSESARYMASIGTCYAYSGNQDKALEYYHAAIKYPRQSGEKRMEGSILSNIGASYFEKGDLAKSLESYNEALKIASNLGSMRQIGNRYANIAGVHQSMGNYKEAITFNQKALDLLKKVRHKIGIEKCLYNLGSCYNDMKEPVKALSYFNEALNISVAINDKRGTGILYGQMGESYLLLDRISEAIENLETGISILRPILGDKHSQVVLIEELLNRIK